MAGFGGFGSSFSYPTRRATTAQPRSGIVQSDPEWETAWQDKLAAIPKTIGSGLGTELIYGAAGYDAAAADPFRSDANKSLDNWFLSGYSGQNLTADQQSGLRAMLDTAKSFGVAPVFGQQDNGASFGVGANPYTDAGGAWAASQGASHQVFEPNEPVYVPNPEYEKAMADYQAAKVQRPENQIRQQQAYDTQMMGNGAVGGVMPANYADPNFGQITGQSSGSFGNFGASDLTSVDQTQQTGAYMGGSGAYNPNPFSAGSFKSQSPWGGF